MTNIVKICYKANFVQETKLLHLQKRRGGKTKLHTGIVEVK